MGSDSPAAQPPSPPLCRICGEPMRPGTLSGKQDRPWRPADVTWTDQASGQIYDITSAGFRVWGNPGALGGYCCNRCGEIEVRVDPKKLDSY